MKIYSTETITGQEIDSALGIVYGSVVQSKHLGHDVLAGLKTLIGGEVKGYSEMLNSARSLSVERMIDDAERLQADAVVNVRFTTSSISQSMCEVLAYGTAVRLRHVNS